MDKAERLQRNLTEQGVSAEDAKMALLLFIAIMATDDTTFPGKRSKVRFVVKPSRALRCIAAYHEPQEGYPHGYYEIRPNGLSKYVRGVSTLFSRFLRNNINTVSEVEILASIAAHEVRHKVQHENPGLLFSKRDATRNGNSALRRIIPRVDIMVTGIKSELIRCGKSKSYIEHHAGAHEFDAWVVGLYLLHRVHGKQIFSIPVGKIMRLRPSPKKTYDKSLMSSRNIFARGFFILSPESVSAMPQLIHGHVNLPRVRGNRPQP